MRLLFDQSLLRKLVARLADVFPDSSHVFEVGLSEASDLVDWSEAQRREECAIVSKDSDFNEMLLLRGCPPYVVWTRRRNCSTDEIESLIRSRKSQIGTCVQAETTCS